MKSRGDRLRTAINARKVNKLLALAMDIGVDESALSRWKSGGAISTNNIIKLCRALDISIDWFLTGNGHMEMHKALSVDQDEYRLVQSLRQTQGNIREAFTTLAEVIGG